VKIKKWELLLYFSRKIEKKVNKSGAIDIIVIKQPNGILKSSPFHVRFNTNQIKANRKAFFIVC